MGVGIRTPRNQEVTLNNSAVTGADGAQIVMTVDGVETPVEAGSYEGEIVICVK